MNESRKSICALKEERAREREACCVLERFSAGRRFCGKRREEGRAASQHASHRREDAPHKTRARESRRASQRKYYKLCVIYIQLYSFTLCDAMLKILLCYYLFSINKKKTLKTFYILRDINTFFIIYRIAKFSIAIIIC